MGRYVWILPGTKQQYLTALADDPNVPAGYRLSNTSDGSGQFADGVLDQDLQTFRAGVNSGGYYPYTGDQSQLDAQPNWPNGIFTSQTGSSAGTGTGKQ